MLTDVNWVNDLSPHLLHFGRSLSIRQVEQVDIKRLPDGTSRGFAWLTLGSDTVSVSLGIVH